MSQPDPEWTRYAHEIVIDTNQIKRPQVVEVPLNPATRTDPDILCIYTGTAKTRIPGPGPGEPSGDWKRHNFRFIMPTQGRDWTKNGNLGAGWTLFDVGAAIAAPASFDNNGQAVNAGWAVDAAWLDIIPVGNDISGYSDALIMRGFAAVRDSDAAIWRISYHATVLGRTL